MTTTEKNILIAQFMGAKIHGTEKKVVVFPDGKKYEGGTKRILEYHSSWDWLIPVVSEILSREFKINSLGLDNEYDELYYNLQDALWTLEIDQVYEVVIEFIEWYNCKN